MTGAPDRLIAPKRAEEDTAELALRPQALEDCIGPTPPIALPTASSRWRRVRSGCAPNLLPGSGGRNRRSAG